VINKVALNNSEPAQKVNPRVKFLQKSNSTSSLYINNTLSVPNINVVLKCTALAIRILIKQGHSASTKVFMDTFDEVKHPLTARAINTNKIPTITEIYALLHFIFEKERLPSEVAILCLAYMERIIASGNITLHVTNWRRVLLAALILAAKVWEEQAVWNVDFVAVFPEAKVTDFNFLERDFLDLINYNVSVTGKIYADYYFELRALAKEKGEDESFPLEPLSRRDAKRLEVSSREREMNIKRFSQRAKSSDNFVAPKSPRHVIN